MDEHDNTHPDAQSVAAKLQRIRAVVGNTAAPAEADYSEDQHAPAMPDIADHGDAGYVTDGLPDVDQLDADLPDTPEEVAVDLNQRADFKDEAAEITADPIVDDVPAMDADDDGDVDDDAAMLSSLALKMAQPATSDADAEVKVEVEVEVEPAVEADVAPAQPAIRAQVLRLRKSDITAPAADTAIGTTVDTGADAFAFNDTDLDDMSYDDDRDTADVAALDGPEDYDLKPDTAHSSLSEEEEADLLEELAEVERDFAPQTDDLDDPSDNSAAPQDIVETKARDSLPETDDGMMSRIMDQTDQELNEPEGSRRRNAIAQLKAAVAATEAARQLGDQSDTAEKTEDAFRDDLKDVVRPKRPARMEKPVERSARPRPAPLKLVASQRIDPPEIASEAPVAPRRVAASAPDVSPSDASNFAEFAESMGATELPDLLEAAAAYTAFVEGSEDFSRPQIMKKVQLTSDVAFSREDGLRSFGTLLRQGRISKVRNGRFQVSDETRFRPDTMAG